MTTFEADTATTGTTADTRTESTAPQRGGERADLLAALTQHRHFLRFTVRGLDDEQIRRRTTVSELTLGGLLKHVIRGEQSWTNFIVDGPSALGSFDEAAIEEHLGGFQLRDDEALAGLLERYDEVAARTDELVARVDLDSAHPLPAAPWFEPGAQWSARRVLLHVIAETSQHAGHADIIREALDGQKTMG